VAYTAFSVARKAFCVVLLDPPYQGCMLSFSAQEISCQPLSKEFFNSLSQNRTFRGVKNSDRKRPLLPHCSQVT